jgi:hypothetical protein
MNVLGAAQCEVQQARADRIVRQLVDDDEAAGLAIVRVRDRTESRDRS